MDNSHIQEDFLTLGNTFLSIISTSTKNNSSHAGTSPGTKTHQGSKCKLEQRVHARTNALWLHSRFSWRGSQQLNVLEQPLCIRLFYYVIHHEITLDSYLICLLGVVSLHPHTLL